MSSESQQTSDALLLSQGRSQSFRGSEGPSQQHADVPDDDDDSTHAAGGGDAADVDNVVEGGGASPQAPVPVTPVAVPSTKTALKALPPNVLKDMCSQLGLTVAGTGKDNKVLKNDYVDALYLYASSISEKPRRAGRPPAAAAGMSDVPARASAAAAGGGAAKTKTPSAKDWAKQRAAAQRKEKDAYFDWYVDTMLQEKKRLQGGDDTAPVFRNAQTAQAAHCAVEERYHNEYTAPMLAAMKTEAGAPIFGVGEAVDGVKEGTGLDELASVFASSALEGDGDGE